MTVVTSVIELLVGLACLGLGAALWPTKRLLSVAIGVAGLVAVVHATAELIH